VRWPSGHDPQTRPRSAQSCDEPHGRRRPTVCRGKYSSTRSHQENPGKDIKMTIRVELQVRRPLGQEQARCGAGRCQDEARRLVAQAGNRGRTGTGRDRTKRGAIRTGATCDEGMPSGSRPPPCEPAAGCDGRRDAAGRTASTMERTRGGPTYRGSGGRQTQAGAARLKGGGGEPRGGPTYRGSGGRQTQAGAARLKGGGGEPRGGPTNVGRVAFSRGPARRDGRWRRRATLVGSGPVVGGWVS
jgi:hypothetical protein